MEYVILKGMHYALPLQLIRKLFNVGKPCSTSATVTFGEDCRYDVGSDQSDINKLFGRSFGMHHKDSARVGWRYLPERDCIEVVTYCYKDSVRLPEKHLCYCSFITPYSFSIELEGNLVHFYVDGEKVVEEELNVGGLSYPLSLYFGGNRKATHKMHIELDVKWK